MEPLKDDTYFDDTAELSRNALMDGLIMEQLMLDGNNERMAKRKAGKYSKAIKASYVDDIMWDNAIERGQAAKELLMGGLEFKDEDIRYLEDKSKEEIYATLFELKQEAMDFE